MDNIWVRKLAQNVRLDNMANIQKDLSLEIKIQSENESSTYYCIHKSIIYAIHDITVFSNESFSLGFNYNSKTNVSKSNSNNLETSIYDTFIHWSEWSACNRCPIGLRKRVGICKIKVLFH